MSSREQQLFTACGIGDLDTVKSLLASSNCDPEIRDKQGNSPLHIACQKTQKSYLPLVRFLVQEKGCDVNCQAKDGSTPLHYVCYNNALVIIKFLLRQRCDTTVQNKRGQTPQTIPLNEDGDFLIHFACQWGDVDIIKFLLQQRCDTKVKNKRGQSPQTILLNEDGDFLIHFACQCGDVDIVKYLISEQDCNMNVRNKYGDTPLHVACQGTNLDIVKYLISEQDCDVNVQNKYGDTPLHVACQGTNLDIVKYLISEQNCDVNVRNKYGDTPLHVACQGKNLDIVKYLISEQHCNVNVQNKNGDSLLHVACQGTNLDIVKYLISEQNCDVDVQNKNGNTPLHVACQETYLDIVKYLITKWHCDVNVWNYNGDSPLHVACQGEKNLTIVKYLITKQHCDVNARNYEGDLPLHIACCNKALDIIKFLLEHRCDTRVRNMTCQSPQRIPLNEDGDLLLHIACQWGVVDIVRYLVYEQQCNVNVRNDKGRSPLHIAIMSRQPSTALCLLKHEQCNPTLPDSNGNTPLHLACMNVDGATEMLQVARFLLSCTDSSCVNNAGQTPVELTANYQLIQDISNITECKTKHSIQTYIKMFFIGNPSTGKSTLVKAIYSEKSWLWKLLPRWFSRVRNVPVRTAGIIPITFRSKKFGNTVLYDMAGQYEYYSSHAAVIENTVLSSPPAFVVVIDLSESHDKIMEKLKYWWSFIDNHSARSIVPPHVILIGSHADVVEVSVVSIQEKMSTISSALQDLSSSFHFVGQVALDCRDPVSSGIDQFCSLVDQSCTALRKTADIDLRCHIAYSFLLERFEGRVACTLSEISAQITTTDTLLPQNPDELAHLMSSLSDKGLVLLIKTCGSIEESWVILQKQELLSEFNGTIFAPENFREHRDFARSTGVVPFARIKHEFSQYDPAMIAGFLTHLEFCFEIDDPETIKRIEDEAPKDETSLDLSDEYYFFPALVSVDNPLQVWQPDHLMQHQCGWYYKCHPDQFLTSRFLHVLILRLAFSFALGLDKYHPSQRAPVLCRRCSVWKHGIGWLQDGIETVVEVGLQCQWVNIMMRCLKGKEVKCVQLRSAVIQEIKNARNEL